MGKLTILAAGVTGYVLGTRAGRERYEQIKTQASKVWGNPTVQSGVETATTQAKHAASTAGAAAASAAASAGSTVAEKVSEKVHDVVSSSDDADDLPRTTAGTPPPTLLD